MRAELARQALAGYANGPGAPTVATNRALDKLEAAEAAILVEGISDQIAIETLARRHGRDLDIEGIVVLPIGGAQAATKYLRELGPTGAGLELAGLCDADAADTFLHALSAAGVARPRTLTEMAAIGFHVCVEDLEDELIRAVGPERVVEVIESQGELVSLRTFQKQPEWRGRPLPDQLRRFFGSKSRRSLRYARFLIEVVEPERIPKPLDAVLDHV